VLTLEHVYGALTFYLANQSEIGAYLKAAELVFYPPRRSGDRAHDYTDRSESQNAGG
jgi:hypothetical protein